MPPYNRHPRPDFGFSSFISGLCFADELYGFQQDWQRYFPPRRMGGRGRSGGGAGIFGGFAPPPGLGQFFSAVSTMCFATLAADWAPDGAWPGSDGFISSFPSFSDNQSPALITVSPILVSGNFISPT